MTTANEAAYNLDPSVAGICALRAVCRADVAAPVGSETVPDTFTTFHDPDWLTGIDDWSEANETAIEAAIAFWPRVAGNFADAAARVASVAAPVGSETVPEIPVMAHAPD